MTDFERIEKFFEVEESIDYLKQCEGIFINHAGKLSDEDFINLANSVYSAEEYIKNKNKK